LFREHAIADLSVNHVERQFLLCGYTVERRQADYGLDLLMATFDAEGNVEGGYLLAQVKATEHLKVVAKGRLATCRIDRTDLRAWLQEPMPVLLLLHDAVAEVTYWLYTQQHFRQQPGFDPDRGSANVTVRIPRTNVLEATAVRHLGQVKNPLLPQMEGWHRDPQEGRP
jgi:hypothetical protein